MMEIKRREVIVQSTVHANAVTAASSEVVAIQIPEGLGKP